MNAERIDVLDRDRLAGRRIDLVNGERILAAFAEDQLTTSMAVYQPVLK